MNNKRLNIKMIIPVMTHAFFGVFLLFMPLLLMFRENEFDDRFYLGYLIRTAILMVVFYINYLYLIDNFLFTRKFILYIAINLCLIVGVVAIQDLLVDTIWENINVPHEHPHKEFNMPPQRPPNKMRLWGEYIFMIFFIGMSVALKATKRWYRDSVNLETIKASQLEADLRNLRSQLNPHFLFNTLNNIYSLIAIDKLRAQESVHRLSGMLRYVLYDNNNKFVPIDKELEFTKNYIDLMALRLNQNVKLNVSINKTDCKNEIASLMFITLIENAFKHGITNDKESFIDIRIFVDKDKGILCTVENSLNKSEQNMESKNSGIGLDNLQKRLNLLYPNKHQLEISQKDDHFYVLLRIDFDNNKLIEE